ncbi:histone H1-like [Heptranchias perlo]|uniref:histone H1-like n=1 Tax=Heptranchias perlo TaxID=212740 RepID=UPI003559D8D1
MADSDPKADDAGDSGVDKAMAKKKRKQQRALQSRKKTGPTVAERILQVAAAATERRGISLAALKKALSGRGYDVSRNNTRVNRTVRQLVKKGSLVQTAGIGASGSFKFNKSKTHPDPAMVAAAAAASIKEEAAKKKSSAKKPTPASSKKSSQTKTSAAKKSHTAKRKVAKPRNAAQTRRKPKFAAGRAAPRTVRVHLKPKSAKGRAVWDYQKYKPARGKKAANTYRRRSPATKPKRPVGRPRKVPIVRKYRGNYCRQK